jgi:hypothetical protein
MDHSGRISHKGWSSGYVMVLDEDDNERGISKWGKQYGMTFFALGQGKGVSKSSFPRGHGKHTSDTLRGASFFPFISFKENTIIQVKYYHFL